MCGLKLCLGSVVSNPNPDPNPNPRLTSSDGKNVVWDACSQRPQIAAMSSDMKLSIVWLLQRQRQGAYANVCVGVGSWLDAPAHPKTKHKLQGLFHLERDKMDEGWTILGKYLIAIVNTPIAT